jgi:hypothetical protein
MARPEVDRDESPSNRPGRHFAELKHLLPWLAAVSLGVALAALAATTVQVRQATRETPETKAAAEAVIDRLAGMQPGAPDEPRFVAAFERSLRAPYVVGAWCFAADGRLARAQGSTAASTPIGRRADELATAEARRLVETMGNEWQGDQRVALLAASAIAAEGEHNDVYRHMLRSLHGPDGRLTGFVGVAYLASPSRGLSLFYLTSLALLLAGLAVYWLALPAWVLLDARERGERALVWASFTAVGNLVALAAYLLTRRPAVGAAVPVDPAR